MGRNLFRQIVFLSVAILLLATCAGPPAKKQAPILSYRKPFLGRTTLPPELDWLKQVRLAAYTQLPTDQDKEQFLKDMDVDIMDWYCSYSSNRGNFMRKRGIRVSGPEEFEYQEALQFSKPDTVAIFSDNGIAVKLDGTPATFPPTMYRGSYFMCHNAPKWHEMVKQGLVRLTLFGHSITQDNIGCPLNKGQGNFCKWCNLKFKRYLRERLADWQIRWLGIKDLNTFDARQYILDRVRKSGNEKAIEDPLVREYIRFQYVSEANAWEDIMQVIRAESDQLGLPMRAVYGNQYGAWGTMPFATALSSRADVVWIECNAFQPTWGDEKQAWNALVYKIGLASGHFNRPVWTWPIGYSDNQVFLRSKMKLEVKKSGSGEPYIGYLKKFPVHLVLCEGLAEGGMAVMRPGDHAGTDVYKMHVEYARFVSQNRALFAFFPHRKRYVNAALIYSFPTWMWRNFSSLGVKDASRDYLPAMARILEEAHIPYEANIFGHPDVWDDSDVLNSLKKYDVVILPSVDCLSERQADALWSYVRGGGSLICWGKTGTRDEDYKLRLPPALADMLDEKTRGAVVGLGKVVQISDSYMKDFLDKDMRERGYEKVKTTLQSLLKDKILLETSAPRTVWINSWLQAGGSRLAIHLMNYDANVEADTMIPAKDVRIRVKPPKGLKFDKVLWIPFGGAPRVLEHRIVAGCVIFTVPEVNVYGVAVLTQGDELQIANSLDAARRARERLNVALEDKGGCPSNIREFIVKAEAATAKGDYATAESASKEALTTGEKLLSDAIAEAVNTEKKSREETISSAGKAVFAFDFGNGPAAPGWKQVKSDTKYDSKVGFGWNEVAGLRGSDGTYPDLLHGDSISADVKRTFFVDLPNADYVVTLVCGHPSAVCARATTAAMAEGEAKLLGVRSYAGVFFNRSFSVTVKDGQLNITFPATASPTLAAKADGPKPFEWNVCGLLVRKAGEGSPPPDLALNDALSHAGLKNWAVAGPFDDPGCEGMEIRYPPESKVDLKASYEGKKGRKIVWRSYASGPGVAVVPFRDLFDEEEGVVAFAYTKVFAPSGMKARLLFGSTGIGQVWLNGKPILRDYTLAGLMADELRKDIDLKQGWNEILVKVCSKWDGPWAFSASLLDAENKPIAGLRTSPAGDEAERVHLPQASPVAHPAMQVAANALEFNKANELLVEVENVAQEVMDGSLCLSAEEGGKDCVRIEPAGAIAFSGLKPGEQLSKVFQVNLIKLPADTDHMPLKVLLETKGVSRVSTLRLRVTAPKVLLSTYNPAREPKELVVDPTDDASAWKRYDRQSVESIVADSKDKKEGGASLCIACVNNGNGIEDFARIQKDFAEGTDWTAYNTLRFWAKVTDEDPAVKKRAICIVLNNHDSGGYQPLARHEIPLGEWTLIEDDISAARRENVSSLVPHLYETYLDKKTSYTWHLNDIRLSKISKSQPAEERPLGAQEIAARVYVSNPSATAMEATLSIQLPDGWRSDLPEGIRVDAPAKKSWCRAFRIVHPANAQGTAYPVVAKLSFPGGACLEVRQEVRPTKRMSLGMIAKPPVLDGKLNDECWKASAPVEGFVLNDGSGLAKAQTRAWMCRDASNLYVAFECLEPAMKQLKADVKDRDGQVWTDDCVEVFIEPGPKPTSNLYHFVFNTLDVLRDEGQSGGAWNSHAKSKTLKGKDRWVIEISIPFVDLDRAPKPDDTWLVNLNRSRQAKPGSDREFSCWSCTFGPFATPERFGELTFEK